MDKKTEKYQIKHNFETFMQSSNIKSESYQKALKQISENLYYDIEWGGGLYDITYVEDKKPKQKPEQTLFAKKPVLDVFDRIKKYEEQKSKKAEFEKLGIVENKGVFSVPNPVFVGSKVDTENFGYKPRKYPKCEQYGREAEAFANNFYDYVLKRKKANKNLLEDKKFYSYLQAGVNFVYIRDEMEGELYKQLSAEELRVLFDYGMNIELAIYEVSGRRDVQEKLVYNAVEEVETPVFFVISPSNLEKLIHTRNNISLYDGFWADYISCAEEKHKFEYIKNVEVMFKYGQISLTTAQVKTIGSRFSSKLDSIPFIQSVYEYCKDIAKVSTETTISQNIENKTVQDAKAQIEKLFEEAQRNI